MKGSIERSFAIVAVIDAQFVIEAAEQITFHRERGIVNDDIGTDIGREIFVVERAILSGGELPWWGARSA